MPSETGLEELLSRPTSPVIEAMEALSGDLLILGASGKMGPSLARLARRATEAAGVERRIVAVARFGDDSQEALLQSSGIETIRADLLDPAALGALPSAPNVIYMVGQKFGTSDDQPRTWVVNAWLPGAVAARFRGSRIVAFSTGNVYPLSPVAGEGPDEEAPTGPVGEYAASALARERVLTYFSRRLGTSMAILRLNYAVELRYGVLRDLADRVAEGRPVELSTSRVNLIWQRDANAVALRALAHCSVPPLLLNLTGRPAHSVRSLAVELGNRLGREPVFSGEESDTALLSDASRAEALFGPMEIEVGEMLDLVADWVRAGGRSLGKPTHFEARDGRF